jgi:hypothetical protein
MKRDASLNCCALIWCSPQRIPLETPCFHLVPRDGLDSVNTTADRPETIIKEPFTLLAIWMLILRFHQFYMWERLNNWLNNHTLKCILHAHSFSVYLLAKGNSQLKLPVSPPIRTYCTMSFRNKTFYTLGENTLCSYFTKASSVKFLLSFLFLNSS